MGTTPIHDRWPRGDAVRLTLGCANIDRPTICGRGRDRPCGRPPAQIRTGAASAYGSYLALRRQTAVQARGVGCEPVVTKLWRVLSFVPTSCGTFDCGGEGLCTTSERFASGTHRVPSSCPVYRGRHNILGPPRLAICLGTTRRSRSQRGCPARLVRVRINVVRALRKKSAERLNS